MGNNGTMIVLGVVGVLVVFADFMAAKHLSAKRGWPMWLVFYLLFLPFATMFVVPLVTTSSGIGERRRGRW